MSVDSIFFLSPLKVIFWDFDGVFTDNFVSLDSNGIESVKFSRSDGIGLSKLRDLGIDSVVVSSEPNPVVAKRCDKLNIKCFHGIKSKISVINHFLASNNLDITSAAYVGNDINDYECFSHFNYTFAPSDAHPEIQNLAKYVSPVPVVVGSSVKYAILSLN